MTGPNETADPTNESARLNVNINSSTIAALRRLSNRQQISYTAITRSAVEVLDILETARKELWGVYLIKGDMCSCACDTHGVRRAKELVFAIIE